MRRGRDEVEANERTKRVWGRVLRRAAFIGSIASVTSTWMLSRRSAHDSVSSASGTNATSHWLWGERAMHRHGVSLRYTATGYLIHHLSALFWASVYERWFAPRSTTLSNATTNAIAVSSLAAATDYLLTPKRLTPGVERHLTLGSMVLVYAAFAVGMAAARRTLDGGSDSQPRSSG